MSGWARLAVLGVSWLSLVGVGCHYDPVTLGARDGDAPLHSGDADAPLSGRWFSLGRSTVSEDGAPRGSASGAGLAAAPEGGRHPAILLDDAGMPVVAFETTATPPGAMVLRYAGSGNWEVLRSIPSPAYRPRLSWGANDEVLYLGWLDDTRTHASRYESTWTGLGNGGATVVADVHTESFDLEWDATSGSLVVAIADGPTANQPLTVWRGATVETVSQSAGATVPSLASLGGQVYVAWEGASPTVPTERRVFVRRRGASDWVDVDGAATGEGLSDRIGLAGEATAPVLVAARSHMVAIWRQQTGANQWEIVAANYDATGTWTATGSAIDGAGIGGLSAKPGDSGVAAATAHTSATFPNEDRTVVAWVEADGSLRARQGFWFQGQPAWWWSSMYGAIDSNAVILGRPGVASFPAIALRWRSDAAIAWTQTISDSPRLYVARWRCGTMWEELSRGATGGLSGTGGCSEVPDIAIDSRGDPIVAWQERAGEATWNIFVRRFDGANWIPLGGDPNITHNDHPVSAGFPEIAVAPTGDIYVAWKEWNFDGYWEAFIQRFDGNGWRQIGNSSLPLAGEGRITNRPSDVLHTELALSPAGSPFVALREGPFGGPYRGVVMSLENGSWGALGATGTFDIGESVTAFDIAVGSTGEPVVAFVDEAPTGTFTMHVSRYDAGGDAWVPIAEADGTVVPAGGVPSQLSVSTWYTPLDQEQTVGLVWTHYDAGTTSIRFTHWHRGEWSSADHRADFDVVSSGTGRALEPDVVFDDVGSVIVVWADDTNGAWNIRARRWDGAWDDIPGTDLRHGISATSTPSRQPRLAYRDGRLCVAWTGNGIDALEIAAKCYDFE